MPHLQATQAHEGLEVGGAWSGEKGLRVKEKRNLEIRLCTEKSSNVIDDGRPVANRVALLHCEEGFCCANAQCFGLEREVRCNCGEN